MTAPGARWVVKVGAAYVSPRSAATTWWCIVDAQPSAHRFHSRSDAVRIAKWWKDGARVVRLVRGKAAVRKFAESAAAQIRARQRQDVDGEPCDCNACAAREQAARIVEEMAGSKVKR